MFSNPFRKNQSRNPLDSVNEEDLRSSRKRLELGRTRLHRQANDLEVRKAALLQQAAGSDQRVRRDIAYQVKTLVENQQHIDQQLMNTARQIQFLDRLAFLRKNSADVGDLAIDKLLGKVSVAELSGFIQDLEVRSGAGNERLQEILDIFDTTFTQVAFGEEDPEIREILEVIEGIALGSVPELPKIDSPDMAGSTEGSSLS